MANISVPSGKRYLLQDGKPYFYLADTIWMAFQKLSLEEWQNYLRLRRRQGFNAVQISVLPIAHDNSVGEEDIEPFALDEEGHYLFDQINEAYFDKAEIMVEMAAEAGITPCLHLFWVNYIPDTWGALKSPERVLPLSRVRELAKYMLNRFDRYHPIYSVTGDTNFETPRVVEYYQAIFDVLEELAPDAVTSMHLMGGLDHVPEELLHRSGYSFYSYQSSHGGKEFLSNITKCSEGFLRQPLVKPLINTEPCYEGLGNFENPYEKFSSFDVRRALWSSVLSGASAGITYGAHGAWGCHKKGMLFLAKSMWGEPYDFQDAIRLDGANDAGFVRHIMENHQLMGLLPAQELTDTPYIMAGTLENQDVLVVYQPFDCEFTLYKELSDYRVTAWNLAARRTFIPELTMGDGRTLVGINGSNHDALYIFEK